jgi:tRNA(fMet)-specific endonuclease VapC
MIFALDTNILVELLRKRDGILMQRYLAKSPGDYSIPEMVRAELLFGAEMSEKAIENRRAVEKLLSPLSTLPFEGDAVIHYAQIRAHLEKAGTPVGPNDLVIAATARSHGHTLVTRNTAEFHRIPALAVEVW